MTRQTDSAPPCTLGGDGLQRVAATAAALLELAVHESLPPVGALAQALARLSTLLPLASQELRAELGTCIESLQFHDRMVQQLAQVRDLLAGAGVDPPATAPGPVSSERHERLRAHFSSESYRRLFNELLPGDDVPRRVRRPAEPGSVELF